MQANPAVDSDVHHDAATASSLPSNQGLLLAFLKDPPQAAADSSRSRDS